MSVMVVVEVGIKLDHNFKYYDKLLKLNGAKNCFNCKTHDVYYTDKSLDDLTENEMKNACIRFRNPSFKTRKEELKLIDNGYKKVIDTTKKDYHYIIGDMKSRIQLQDIKDVGLLVYYDNPDYYEYPLEEQRKMLIDELNSYGFNFSYDTLGLDKLRTLYYKKEMYSMNQNG